MEDAISRDYHNKLIEIKEKEELKMKFNLHLRKIKEEKEIEELRLMKLGLNRDASKKRRNAPSAMPNGNNVERQITNEVDDDTKRLYHDIDMLKEGTIYRKLNCEEDHMKIATDKQLERLLCSSCDQYLLTEGFKSSKEYPMLKSFILSALLPMSSFHHMHLVHESSGSAPKSITFPEKGFRVESSFDINLKTLISFLEVYQLRKLRYDRQMQCVLLKVCIFFEVSLSFHIFHHLIFSYKLQSCRLLWVSFN